MAWNRNIRTMEECRERERMVAKQSYDRNGEEHNPSQSEIARLCSIIRSRWDARTEESRRVISTKSVYWNLGVIVPGPSKLSEKL